MVRQMKQMPPLGSELTDRMGLGQVDAWINDVLAQ
jgi:hypothetical protein